MNSIPGQDPKTIYDASQYAQYGQQYMPPLPMPYAAPYGHAPMWSNFNYASQPPFFQPPVMPFGAPFDLSRNFHTASMPQQNLQTLPDRTHKKLCSPTPDAIKKRGQKPTERNVAVPPSKASGGIPDPLSAYLAKSLEGYSILKQPQHLLVIIDLNGTLLHRPTRSAPTKFTARPHTPRFLNYCITTFSVVIWSSARPENVNAMTSNILPHALHSQIVAIWGRDKFGLSSSEYNNKVQCYKRLEKVWNDEKIKISHPNGGVWDQTNTVLIDDSNYKGRSEPYNLIEIPEYSGGADEEVDGHGVLPEVHDYLNRLSMCSNVSSYLRLHPFVFERRSV